jgi:hypothetical protein
VNSSASAAKWPLSPADLMMSSTGGPLPLMSVVKLGPVDSKSRNRELTQLVRLPAFEYVRDEGQYLWSGQIDPVAAPDLVRR